MASRGKAKTTGKKPRMKTAAEVVKRIMWDDDLPEGEFMVGYVDRFVGVLERPFLDFNWDFAAADPEDPAIPEHRIEYFKYKSAKVWEKATKLDLVFGSVGQNLPSINDTIRREDRRERDQVEENLTDEEKEEEDYEIENSSSEKPQDFVSEPHKVISERILATQVQPEKAAHKYAVILPLGSEDQTSVVARKAQDVLTSNKVISNQVRRLASARDLHLTLAVFETDEDPNKVARKLSSLDDDLRKFLNDSSLELGPFCLLKDTVVASRVTRGNFGFIAGYLHESLTRMGYLSEELTCLHVTLARLRKPEMEAVTEDVREALAEEEELKLSCSVSEVLLKMVGDERTPAWRLSF